VVSGSATDVQYGGSWVLLNANILSYFHWIFGRLRFQFSGPWRGACAQRGCRRQNGRTILQHVIEQSRGVGALHTHTEHDPRVAIRENEGQTEEASRGCYREENIPLARIQYIATYRLWTSVNECIIFYLIMK
jgi:hypothetical protein